MGAGRLQQRVVPGHPGAGVDGVAAFQDQLVIRSVQNLHLGREGRRGIGLLEVGQAHRDAASCEVANQGAARQAGADDQGALAHGQTARRASQALASAERAPAPQKESAMRFSDQPSMRNVWWIGVILKTRRPPVALK